MRFKRNIHTTSSVCEYAFDYVLKSFLITDIADEGGYVELAR